jgi:hypothetical protein
MAVVVSVLLALAGGGPENPVESVPRAVGEIIYFASPSRNIACALHDGSARCEIRQKEWTPPPRPPSCNLDWGYAVSVGRHDRGRFLCAGDTVRMNNERVLPYGRDVGQGAIRCTMRVSGVRCVNTRNGHGFFLSKEKARLF